MDHVQAVEILEGVVEVEYEGQDIEALQCLIDSGVVWHLQGSYQRMACNAIRRGLCSLPEVT